MFALIYANLLMMIPLLAMENSTKERRNWQEPQVNQTNGAIRHLFNTIYSSFVRFF